MKNVKIVTKLIIAILLFNSCSDYHDLPEVIHEEELITTITITLNPESEGTKVTLQKRDLDGDGPDAPTFAVSGNLVPGVTYNGSIELLNETESPAEDITEEVEKEDLDHQFFYTIASDLDVVIDNANLDSKGNILGTEFKLIAGAASSGLLTVTLRHEPTKPNTGLVDAGGETDIEASFNVVVE
jgi:hypothetical protein